MDRYAKVPSEQQISLFQERRQLCLEFGVVMVVVVGGGGGDGGVFRLGMGGCRRRLIGFEGQGQQQRVPLFPQGLDLHGVPVGLRGQLLQTRRYRSAGTRGVVAGVRGRIAAFSGRGSVWWRQGAPPG